MTEFVIEKALLTDVGRKRPHNEDFVGHFEPPDPADLASSGRMYIVADGVGGGAAGEVASEYAVGKVLHEYYRSAEPDLGRRLQAAIRQAHADLFGYVEQNPELGRMGTTLVAAIVHGDKLIIGNVGDSRAYLIRNGEIRQITRDHSLVAQLVEEGSITAEEAETHPRRNVLLRSLGVDPSVHPDLFEGTIQPGDQVLLCSDGLTRHVSDGEMLEAASRSRPERAVPQLVEMANVRGGRDNISIVLLRVGEAVPLETLAKQLARRRELVEPEFEELQNTVYRRREAPQPPRRPPVRVWLVGALAVVLLALVALAAIWLIKAEPGGKLPGDGDGAVTSTSAPAFDSPLPAGTLSPTPTDTVTVTVSPTVETAAVTTTATPQPEATPTPAGPAAGDTWTRPADGMIMVYVPAGEFQMGSTEGYDDEEPVHAVTLDAFQIDRTEVTNAQYEEFLNAMVSQKADTSTWLDLSAEACRIEQADGEYRTKDGYADHPAVCVSWYGAQAYCEGAGGRLPTEAEWEYAARGPEGRVYPWGDAAPTCRYAQYRPCQGKTAAVGNNPQGMSWCGALGMAGNVWEWTASLFQDYPYQADDGRNDPDSEGARVLRGGSWGSDSTYVRSANRWRSETSKNQEPAGFRCVVDVP